jgi:hypothetical protein
MIRRVLLISTEALKPAPRHLQLLSVSIDPYTLSIPELRTHIRRGVKSEDTFRSQHPHQLA